MNAVQIATYLYDARDTARKLLGNQYPEKIEKYKEIIKVTMERTGKPEITTTMNIVKDLQKKFSDSGIQQMMLFAACVELVEPEG